MSAPSSHHGDDVEMAFTNNENRAKPPARLATRIHRNSNNRRRSSAHSSRCSSLSSRQSRSSALSCHGGPRSTHVAQHLRRASIIESRKARLADRAAHAEQVRLRAAAVKAASRATYSEEKTLAAQAAREKLLAEITARCEEEVRRVKKVAEDMKEKRAAENARRRDELEEKHAVAAKRRTLNQSTPRRARTTSLAAVEEKKVDTTTLKQIGQTTAAKVIQRAWRRWQRRKIILDFLRLNLTVPNLSRQSFDEVTSMISEDASIRVTRALLNHLALLDSSGDETAERGATRVFLSSYMILSHPTQAFSHGGKDGQERDLRSKGEALLAKFEARLLTEASPGGQPVISLNDQEQLQFLFNDFNAAFHAWKSQDLNVLLDVMVGSFVNLDLILQSTKDDTDGRVADDYLQAVRHEQIKLLARLKRLAGPEEALSRVRAAVKKARKERASKQKKSSRHVPRVSSDAEVVLDIPTQEPLTPPATPGPHRPGTDNSTSSFVRKLGETMTVLPSNRDIAHEMQISGSFEVQQQPWTESRTAFMDSLRKSMRESMQSGGTLTAVSWTNAMVILIKDKLLNLISQKHPLYDRIDGLLDARLIEQQSRNHSFSYQAFFDNIGSIIAQLCSPGRDEIVNNFINDTSSDVIDRLFSLINIIDLMTLDHINFQFRMATRSVVEHGHEHEHAMFERDLRERKHTLENARQWWATARDNLPARNPHNASYGTAIYSRGLADLVLSNTPIRYDALPETLRLDWIRLLNLRARAFQNVAMASILLTTKIRLRRNREAIWATDAERLKNLDLTSTDAERIVALIESGHMMPDSTREGLLNFVSRVLPSASAAVRHAKDAESSRAIAIQEHKPWDPACANGDRADYFIEQIATFILKSLREHVYARLSASSTAERVRVTTSAPETLARIGMPEFVAEVSSMIEVLEKIRHVDLKAHGKWYDEIAAATTVTTENTIST